jgi:putative proteasome-type protease
VTYCLGIKVKEGIIFCSDSRTNAGIDLVNTYKKMYTFGVVGQSQFCILASGNLATTQGVINQIRKDIDNAAELNLLSFSNFYDAVEYIGRASTHQQSKTGGGPTFAANFIVGGQIAGKAQELAKVYPEGNYISATKLAPFLQIGESKYGKPILDRIISIDTTLETCALCALVSMGSTIKSNLSVGPPIDIQFYYADSLKLGDQYHFDENDSYIKEVDRVWGAKLIESFMQLPSIAGHAKNLRDANQANDKIPLPSDTV